MVNSLDPDEARRLVGPHLDPNCLQRLSADDAPAGKKLMLLLSDAQNKIIRHD